jgi:hypothetical protein
MASPFHFPYTRVAVLAAALVLAGCGGGGGGGSSVAPPPAAAPTIVSFAADRDRYFVGESAQLTLRFSGGTARVEPDIGPVSDGARVTTPVLAEGRTFRLIVEGPGGRAVRELVLEVRHRDRYASVGSLLATQHATVAMPDGAVLIIGGSRAEGVLSQRITRFDPQSRSLQEIGLLQIGRADHRATVLADGSVLVTGGEASLPGAQRIERFDPRTGIASAAGELTSKRSSHAATRLSDGRVLITGGYSSGAAGVLDRAELWDPSTQTARLIPDRMSTPRASHTASLLADGRVLIVGGYAPAGAPYVLAELFDPQRESFTPVEVPAGIANRLRLLHSAYVQADGSVLIVGGEHYDHATEVTEALSDLLRYDPASGRIVAAGALLGPRSAVAGDRVGSGVLLFGGLGANDARLASAELVEPGQPARPLATLPGERTWHTVTRLQDGRVLIVGGEDGQRNYVPSVLLYE